MQDSKNFKWPQAILGFLLLIALFVFATKLEVKMPIYLFAGLMLGYVLTRSRYGFAGGVKRLYLRGEGTLTKSILLLLAVTSIVFFGIQWKAAMGGAVPAYEKDLIAAGAKLIPGTQNVYFTNIATVVGGLIFGFGMMLAGGCGSGTLADLGEGEGRALIAFVFFVLSAAPGEWARRAIDKTAIGQIGVRLHLPQVMGYGFALLATLAALALLYLLTVLYERMRKKEGTYADPMGDYEEFERPLLHNPNDSSFFRVYHKLFVERWSFNKGALMLAIAAIFVMVTTNKAWGVSTPLVTLDVALAQALGIPIPQELVDAGFVKRVQNGLLNDGGTVRNIGMFFGCAIAFLLAGRYNLNFKFRFKDALWFALGGIMLGFGSRFAFGCNIGAMYSAITNFSISGWVFLVSMALGGYIALKIMPGKVCIIGTIRKEQIAKKKLNK